MPDKETELKLARVQETISDHYKQGNYKMALDGSKTLLKQTENHFGRDHSATASAYNNLGLMHKLLGDFVEARKHYQVAMRIYGKVVGRDHASYAMTLHNLGALNKSQVHFDTTLKATERLSLVETALEHFEEALLIRQAELGDTHPHCVATKSSLGSTLAAQVLYQHRFVEKKGSSGAGTYVALNPESVTKQSWQAAETHLREAMETATQNPRGKSTKSNKKKMKKAPKKASNAIQTLSAAAAAQNLAVFLKSRAVTSDPPDKDMLKEAQSLYKQVLDVRLKLLPSKTHPDVYATQFSLAEVLQAMGDEEAANALRQEILDTYHPDLQQSAEEEQDEKIVVEDSKRVVVEKSTNS